MPLLAQRRIGLSTIRRHHDLLVQTLLRTPSDYNLDFPAIVFPLNDADSSLFTTISVALEQSAYLQEFCEVTVSQAARAGVYRGTAHLRRPIWPIERTSSVNVRDHSKVRFTLSVPAQELRLRPLPQLTLADEIETSALSFSDPYLAQSWKRFSLPVSRESADNSTRTAALFRLLTAFLTVSAGDLIAREVTRIIHDHLASDPYLDTRDPIVVLTQENSDVLAEMFSTLQRRQDPVVIYDYRMLNAIEPDDKDRRLLEDFKSLWKSTSERFLPCTGDTAYEGVSKLLLSLHDVTDTDAIRVNHPDASRLDVGLSYYGIVHLLQEHCNLDFSDREIGLGIDIAVDNGQAVPKVLNDGAFWTRRFYSGEARLGNAQLQFKAALYEHYSSFLQTGRTQLSPFEMTKVCVTLKDLCPRLPISTRYRTFGRTATIGLDELTVWLTRGAGSPFKIDGSGSREVVELNPQFHPPVDSGWTDSVGLEFANLFLSIAPVYRKVPSDAVVLLSTCRTHRHAYNAVALEAHNWAGRDEGGFDKVLDALSATGASQPVGAEALRALYYCCRYLDEAHSKYRIFHNKYSSLKDKLHRAFGGLGPYAVNYWRYTIDREDFLSAARDADIEWRFGLLSPLIAQMHQITAYVVGVLFQSQLLTQDKLEETFKARGVSSGWRRFQSLVGVSPIRARERYNNNLAKRVGSSFLRTELPMVPGSGGNLMDLFVAVRRCFDELRQALCAFCPEYQVSEGDDFPFAPDNRRRIMEDGTEERVLENQYILALDIIKSTGSMVASEVKNAILGVLDERKTHGLHYTRTGDDCFVCCCADPKVIWDLAVSIRVIGVGFRKVGDPFAGTRKGMHYGQVMLNRSPDGVESLKDGVPPHIIPQAVGLISGVDGSALAEDIGADSVLAVSDAAASHAREDLNLNLDATERVDVEAKHFRARVYAFGLVSEG